MLTKEQTRVLARVIEQVEGGDLYSIDWKRILLNLKIILREAGMKDIDVTDCKVAMMQEISIAKGKAKDGCEKTLSYHVWDNEYRIKHKGNVVDTGEVVSEMLNEYNDL